MHGHEFTWFQLIPGLEHVPSHLVGLVFVVALVVGLASVAGSQVRRALAQEGQGLVPEARLTFRNAFEVIGEQLYRLVVTVIGEHDAHRFFPAIGTLFLLIFASNLMGLIPGLLPPTDNMNTTLAFGTFVFVYYNYLGLKENGLSYLKHFLGPVWWLAPLMLVVELISHVFRPLTLALRLRGNIVGDHMVLSVFSDLFPPLVPIVFYGFGLFVSFIQAFVFCLLTMVYISLSIAHEEEH